MTKSYISQIYNQFIDETKWKILKNNFRKDLKKFQKYRKKRVFIVGTYPHRKSDSIRKGYIILRRYLVKEKLWYKGKKQCLLFFNFEYFYNIIFIINDQLIENKYDL